MKILKIRLAVYSQCISNGVVLLHGFTDAVGS